MFTWLGSAHSRPPNGVEGGTRPRPSCAVDPCGENGEFHSFAYEGPMFGRPVRIEAGELRVVEGFVFADLVAGGG
jgi:diphthamide synthase (EF-2-diphthine--ammonia ligase)